MVPKDVPLDVSLFCIFGSDQNALLKSPSRDWRPHVEHVIHWSLTNVQRVMALVDPGDECSLVHGKPEQFPGRSTYINGYSAQSIEVEAVSLPLEIGQLPV